MIDVKELREWLSSLPDDAGVGVDDGGLTLCGPDGRYIEVGGLEEEPEDDGNGPNRFLNHYKCPKDGTEWSDESQYTNNDRCPNCDLEVSPTESEDL